MWESVNNIVADYLDPIGIVVGLIVTVPVFWSWLILLGNRRRQKQLIKNIQKTTGDRPAALVVNVGPGDVSNQVRAFLIDNQQEMDVDALNFSNLNMDTVPDFVQTLRSKRAALMVKGVGKVHLFYFGPVAGALLVGDGAVVIYY